MSRPWKHPKTGVYYFRKVIPDPLRAFFGKREFKESLGTKEPSEAKARYAPIAAKYEAMLAQARDATAAGPQQHPLPTPEPLTYEQDEEMAKIIRQRAAESPNRITMTRRITGEELERWKPEPSVIDLLIGRGSVPVGIPGRLLQPSPGDSYPNVTFDAVIAGWQQERQPAPKTAYDWKRFAKQLQAYVGHDNAAAISDDDVLKWKAALLEQGLHDKTINTRLTAISGLFGWAVRNKRLPMNPAKGILVSRKKKPKRARLPFSEDQARKVLAVALASNRPEIGYVTLLQAYTGDRISSIAQLRKSDVRKHGMFWVLDLNADEEETLSPGEIVSQKNSGSVRQVPLHPAVIAAGFLRYVEQCEDGPLFSMVPPDRFGKRGGVLTKRYSRWLREEAGVTDKRLVNHSWRHWFKDWCREFEIPDRASDQITGHREYMYGDGFTLAKLYDYLCKLPDLTSPGGVEGSALLDAAE